MTLRALGLFGKRAVTTQTALANSSTMCVCIAPVTVYFSHLYVFCHLKLILQVETRCTTLLGGSAGCKEVRTPNRTPQPTGSSAPLSLPPGHPLLQASGCVRNAKGYVGLLTIAWGLGTLVSAPCTAERRLLASDRLCLSFLMTN